MWAEAMKKDIDLQELVRRVEILERAVMGDEKPRNGKPNASAKMGNFDGATGGVRFVFSKGFFDGRQVFAAVEKELQDNGYHYSKQAIQMALTRLSAKGGPLVALKDKGKKVYVKRK
jgi:hypothetical protein